MRRPECERSGAGEGDLKIGARGALDNVTGLKSTSLSRLPSRQLAVTSAIVGFGPLSLDHRQIQREKI